MTAWDRVFLALAVVDLIALVALGYGAALLLETGKRGQRHVEPALNEARALAQTGKAIVDHACADGHVVAKRLTLVATRVKHRLSHTRQVVQALKPEPESATTVIASGARKARTLGDVAKRVARLKTAADAAAHAARNS